MDRKKDVFFLVDQSTRSPDTNRINHEKVKIQLIPKKKKIPTLGNPSLKNLLLSSGEWSCSMPPGFWVIKGDISWASGP